MVKRVAALFIGSVILAGCSKAVPEGCPELIRSASIPMNVKSSDPTDFRLNEDLKVNDCLNEHTGMLAQGKSTDEDIAKAAVSFCGGYGKYLVVTDDQVAKGRERAESDALDFAVTSRALGCPPPLHRKLVGTNYVLPKRPS